MADICCGIMRAHACNECILCNALSYLSHVRPDGRDGCCSAKLTLAGSYAISAFIGNHMLPGWPLAVHVQPTACDATKCWLSGPAMQVQSQHLSLADPVELLILQGCHT